MTQHEYREVQLSKKEVLFLFISLIVLAVVIFLLGVAVGRGVRDAVNDPPVTASAGDSETVVPAEQQPKPAQELGYHDLLAGSGTAAAGSGAAATPPVTPPSPVTETVPPPAAEPQAPPSAPQARGDWFLQVGAFSGRQAADAMVGNLKKLNVPAFVLAPGSGSPDKLFRVRVGPYGSQDEANGVRARLIREGFSAEVRR